MRAARHDDLAAAGLLCFAIGLPVVAACACVEVYLTRFVV
jgi:hypothetical protein